MVKKRTALLFIFPSLIGVVVFYFIPFLFSFFYAFSQGVNDVHFVGFHNFKILIESETFRKSLINTTFFLLISIPLLLFLASFLSLTLVKKNFIWQQWALLLPLVIPVSSFVSAWQKIWDITGPINKILSQINVAPIDFLYGDSSFVVLIVLYILKNVGYITIILTNSIRSLPKEQIEYFILCSKNEFFYFKYVLFPHISSTFFFVFLISIINYFLLFRDVFILYGNNPPPRIYMIQHFMNNYFYNFNYQGLGAASLCIELCLLFLIIAVLFLQRRNTLWQPREIILHFKK